MSRTISRLYNSHAESRAAVRELEAAGVPHGDISILVSNADSCPYRKSHPDVLMVQSSEHRPHLDAPPTLNRPPIRRILAQG